jgi:uncharacterized membrane protein YeaQ/YmgE (transglycosylase-associated protein family)
MKRILEMIGWAVGSIGAVVWTIFWISAMIYTRKYPTGALAAVVIGIYGAWEGFKMFRQARTPN